MKLTEIKTTFCSTSNKSERQNIEHDNRFVGDIVTAETLSQDPNAIISKATINFQLSDSILEKESENKISAKPFVNFKEANSLEEARQWGIDNIGISGYYEDFTDLEIMNFINESLYELKTQFGENSVIPKYIDGKINTPHPANAIMCIARYDDDSIYMGINSEYLKNIDKPINNFINKFLYKNILTKDKNNNIKLCSGFQSKKTDDIEKLINKYQSMPNQLSLKEKLTLQRTLSSMDDKIQQLCYDTNDHIKNMMEENNINSFVWKGKNYKADELIRFTEVDKCNIVNSLFISPEVKGHFKLDLIDGKQFVFHEFGHLIHKKAIGNELFYKMDTIPALKQKGLDTSITFDFLRDEKKQNIARKISKYATNSPAEFVAEVFSMLMLRKEFSKDVMELYEQYGGPMV